MPSTSLAAATLKERERERDRDRDRASAGARAVTTDRSLVDTVSRHNNIARRDGEEYDIPYLNHYLPAGGVVVPVGDPRTDDAALARLAEIYPDREIVGVPGGLLSYGGGGPHCITQQIPRR
jgi:agmatine deiminase